MTGRGSRTVSVAVAGAAVAGLLLLGSCGSGDPASGTRSVGDAPQRHVRVGLTEWTVVTSATAVPAGRVRLTVTNTGATEHDLVVQGDAGRWHTPVLDPGDESTLVIRAEAGEQLSLWCDEPGHRAQGMQTALRVAS